MILRNWVSTVHRSPLRSIEARTYAANSFVFHSDTSSTMQPSLREPVLQSIYVLGKSGDGGIDGVIRQDALGLNKVYVQAKRYAYENSVGRPVIQQFFGSLSSWGADRGVFITTSRFSEEAKLEAEIYKTIILIDGIRLTKLMLEYKVGVQPAQHLTLFQVDEDYFDSDLG
ncbi:hypothetical protein DC090_02645 [Trueperella pyogenes]|nr:hypothetical protein DC090_02645 [Trueperella pyogenes]AWG16158.1 hypothetical protein DDE06_04570 [Trueperella pyogenes]AZR05041.1 hypothetical protein EBQ11_07175 [Trueperella pyogenes]